MNSEEDLRRERRAKMAELEKQMNPRASYNGDGHTSAPSVRNVDQFLEQYGQADRQTQERVLAENGLLPRHRHLVQGGGIRNGDLSNQMIQSAEFFQRNQDHNTGIEECSLEYAVANVFGSESEEAQTIGTHHWQSGKKQGISRGPETDKSPNPWDKSDFSSQNYKSSAYGSQPYNDPKLVEEYNEKYGEAENVGGTSGLRRTKSFSDARGRNYDRELSHTTKIYDEGDYKDIEAMDLEKADLGYHSSTSPTNLNQYTDHLEASLKDFGASNRSRYDLSDSMRAKCVYDTRIFHQNKRKAGADTRTEEEYFKAMDSWTSGKPTSGGHDGDKSRKTSFKEFLTNSFNKAFPKEPLRTSLKRSKVSTGEEPSTCTLSTKDDDKTIEKNELESEQKLESSALYQSQSYTHDPKPLLTLRHPNSHNASSTTPLSPSECIDLGKDRQVGSGNSDNRRMRHHNDDVERQGHPQGLRSHGQMTRSSSPTSSVLTASEFGDADHRGHSRMKPKHRGARDLLTSRFTGFLIMIPGLRGLWTPPEHPDNRSQLSVNRGGANFKGDVPHDDIVDDDELSKGKRRRLPCSTVFLLVAVDIFTICLLVILFAKLQDVELNCKIPPITDHSRGNHLSPEEDPTFSKRILNQTGNETVFNTNGNETDIEIRMRLFGNEDPSFIQEPKNLKTASSSLLEESLSQNMSTDASIRMPGPTSGDSTIPISSERTATLPTTTTEVPTTPRVPSVLARQLSIEVRDLQQNIEKDLNAAVEELTRQIRGLRDEVEKLKNPPTFSCYKSAPHWNEGVITFTRCNIETEGMNHKTGVFTVKTPGVYQLSFTGMFNSQNGHRVTADIIRKRSENTFDFLGRAAAETEERGGMFGFDDDLRVTNSLVVVEYLNYADMVYVSMTIEGNHGKSFMDSNAFYPEILFTAQRISN